VNRLYYGDTLQVLREHIGAESVDLIYLDPPFNSKRDYNLLFKSPKGVTSEAQIEAFEDTWHWNEQAEPSGPWSRACQRFGRGKQFAVVTSRRPDVISNHFLIRGLGTANTEV